MRKLKLLTAIFTLLLAGGLIQKANAQSWTGNEPAEGTFLLYNVGADKFINNGDPAQEWGTNAYLQAGFGMDIKFPDFGKIFVKARNCLIIRYAVLRLGDAAKIA